MNMPILSYFFGGGFLDLGFEKAGFRTVWSNELLVEIIIFNR
jgi:DNA (cytosine-5)-methyltransferase 1